MSFGDSVRAERIRRGWSQQDLAERVGTTQSTIDRIERGESARSRLAPAISAILEIGIPVPGKPNHIMAYFDPKVQQEYDNQVLEIYGTYGEKDGTFKILKVPADVDERIRALRGVKDAFGLKVLTYDMEPSYEPNDVVFINPNLPLVRNCDVIIAGAEDRDPKAPSFPIHHATLARLVSWNEAVWNLRYWNLGGRGGENRSLPRDVWPHAWRIVGKTNRI